ncbi:hypothetical protein SHIRM173S_08733 [Streptomyces hirsutus]
MRAKMGGHRHDPLQGWGAPHRAVQNQLVGTTASWGPDHCPLLRRALACGLPPTVLGALGTGLALHVGRSLLREVRRNRTIARTAQRMLRPPAASTGWPWPPCKLSADRGARIGGDLYEVVATEYGDQVVGDVRGHGLGAVPTVDAVLAGFREAVHDEPDLAGVLRRLERAMDRHLRERARAERLSARAGHAFRTARSSSPSCCSRSSPTGRCGP